MARDKRAEVIDLREGPGHLVRIPIEPRPKNVWYQGEMYFRMDNTTHHPEGEPIGQCYLWTGFWEQRLAARETPTWTVGQRVLVDPRQEGNWVAATVKEIAVSGSVVLDLDEQVSGIMTCSASPKELREIE